MGDREAGKRDDSSCGENSIVVGMSLNAESGVRRCNVAHKLSLLVRISQRPRKYKSIL